jgi:hypothetical protein
MWLAKIFKEKKEKSGSQAFELFRFKASDLKYESLETRRYGGRSQAGIPNTSSQGIYIDIDIDIDIDFKSIRQIRQRYVRRRDRSGSYVNFTPLNCLCNVNKAVSLALAAWPCCIVSDCWNYGSWDRIPPGYRWQQFLTHASYHG